MKPRLILLLGLVLSATVVVGTEPRRKSATLRGELATTTTWVLPHVFHLNPANTSSIQVSNNSTTDTINLDINLRAQAGGALTERIRAQIAPRATRNFPLNILEEGFIGSAIIFCTGAPCVALGTWEFDFGGTDQFRVGIPAVSARFSDNQWGDRDLRSDR